MIAKCEINDKAIKIISQPYSVRAIVRGDKVVFSVNDILYACGIKAPRKWVERNADKFSWMWADSYPYPVKTVKGWRTNKVVFVSGVVGKKLVRLTACSEPIREWLLDEVLTYYPNKEADEICSHRFDDGCSSVLRKMIFGSTSSIFRQTDSQMRRMKKQSWLNLLFFDQPKLRTKRTVPLSR